MILRIEQIPCMWEFFCELCAVVVHVHVPMAEKKKPERGCILVLCGLPASGKTTLTSAVGQHINNSPLLKENYVMYTLCYDEILPQDMEKRLIEEETKAPVALDVSHIPEGRTKWKEYREAILACAESLLLGLINYALPEAPLGVESDIWARFKSCVGCRRVTDEASPQCFVIVLDDNMYYSSMRYQYYQLARKYCVGFCQLCLTCDPAESVQRNAQREEGVSPHVIHTMGARFECPDPGRNPWEAHSLILDKQQNLDLKCIVSLIDHASQNPVQPMEEVDGAAQEISRRACSESLLHQVDQILRKLVSEYIHAVKGSISKDQLTDFARKVNSVKTSIHTSLKDGSFLIPSHLTSDMTDVSRNSTSPFYVFILEHFQRQLDLQAETHGAV